MNGINGVTHPFFNQAAKLGAAGIVSGAAMGLSKKIGEAITKKDAHVVTNELSDLFTKPVDTYKSLTKEGWNYFGDMLNNILHTH